MAKKTLTPAETKVAIKDVKQALKNHAATLTPFTSDVKAADKALAEAKKTAEKAVAAAQKAVDVANTKLTKATAAHDKGKAKLDAQLAALQPAGATE